MGIFKDTMTLYKRELTIFRNHLRTNVLRSIIFPLVIITFLGNVGFGVSKVPVAIVSYANNPQAQAFISSLYSGTTLSVKGITNQENGLSMLKSGEISILIVITPTFPSPGAPGVDIYYSTSQITNAGAAIPFIQNAAKQYGSGVVQSSQSQPSDLTFVNPTYGTKSSYKDFLLGGIIVMVSAFGSIFGGGISIITDRQVGNLKTYLIAPVNRYAIVISKILSGTTQSVLYGGIALTIGLLDGATVAMGWTGLLPILVLLTLVSIGFSNIAIMLASRIEKIEVYAIMANVLVMPLWFLSGAFFPTSSLPSWLYAISVYNPMTYAVEGIRDIIMTGYYPIGNAAVDVAVLLFFSVVSTYMSFKLFKKTIE